MPATLEQLWGLNALTQRDANANNLTSLLPAAATPRIDCPAALAPPRPRKTPKSQMTAARRAELDAQPLPHRGNVNGALLNLKKAELKLSGGNPAEVAVVNARFAAIKTRGDARAYAAAVMEKVRIAREQRAIGRRTLRTSA
ncbi:MAG TPA: hypothetical protein VJZ76_00660 [Thermoanaerobaculia bacterium]|nr:hypothetical protein [Thermoanaerobaculia bacterium]